MLPEVSQEPPVIHFGGCNQWDGEFEFLANIGVNQHAEGQHRMNEGAEKKSKPNPEKKL
jgi:hypothetical protein